MVVRGVLLWLLLVSLILSAAGLSVFGGEREQGVGGWLMVGFFVAVLALDFAGIEWHPLRRRRPRR